MERTEAHKNNTSHKKLEENLKERVKELNCLYGISKLVEKPGILVKDIIQGIVNIIPAAWQYPEITCARIIFQNQVFQTSGFMESRWKLVSSFVTGEKQSGTLEVFYLKEKPEKDEGPFLTEERKLIDAITERLGKIITHLQTEERRKQLLKELYRKNRELDEFSYSVSHDLRAPLRAIKGFSEIIARRHRHCLNQEGQHYFDNIIEASAQMWYLIEDLLTYSHLGRNSVKKVPVSLSELLEKIIKNLDNLISKTGGSITVPDNMPVISGDQTLLNQIFNNLIENALIYHRPGVCPIVKLNYSTGKYSSKSKRKENIIISVADNGIGILPRFHKKIFDMFQRIHSKDEYSGTGIGLAIVKKSAELLDGRVWLESEVSKGSTFYIEFPISGNG